MASGDGSRRQQDSVWDFQADRRGVGRYRSLCRIARVTRAQDAGLWRVRNISENGMMLQASVEVVPGEDVEVALSEDTLVSGRIVWARDGCCGVSFAEPIDVEEMLADLAKQQQAESFRALRLPVDAEAILVTARDSLSIELVDISKTGAGFRSAIRLDAGQLVDIILPGDATRRSALIRWANGLRGGLWFTAPLDQALLESVRRLGTSR